MHQLIGALPHESLRNLAKKYGPLMHLQLGELSTIIVSSPEVAKEVMKTHDVIFASRPNILIARFISYDSTNISFSPYGSYWRQLRKICTVELLTQKRVQSFQFIREEEVSSLIDTIASNEGSVINISDLVSSLTNDILSRAAFGKKSRDGDAFVSTLEAALQLAAGFSIADLYPSIKMLRLITGVKHKLEKIHKKFDRILENIIIILDLFSAGTETSSTTVVWAMSEILSKPRVMEEAQAEVRRVFDKKGYVDEADFDQLKYLKAIVKETLRLHPPLPLILPRESGERCEINGYEIPAKTRVIINAWAIGRDPNYWTEAEKFKPERFLDNLIDYSGIDFEFIPFGAGRRICPGMTFGIANVELPLAKLLYHFDWKLPNGMKPEDLDVSESQILAVTLKKKVCEPKSSSSLY
ncbi:Cytochrome P450 [Quillaja saponaria]|uniref:Cytochrome P450 n=1 Tax=Quillaja saponaria TaxID=32244 RepID=A0AAD7PQR6_QUISA|nr:Cytochrome P450 [Quillaja saponaria]